MTLRALLVAVLLTFVAGFWIRESEIVALGVYITESVPAIPAVAAILLVLLGNTLVLHTRWARHAFSRGEMLFVFLFVCVSTTAFSCGVARFFLALMTAPFYFMQTGNKLGEAQKYIPDWAAVHDPAVVRPLYEALRHGSIPWGVWATPLLAWLGFFLALWLAMMCMVMLMHRPWIEKEKLTFPLVQLPLEITETKARGGVPAFFRNPVMWAGFGLSFAYNMVNIIHAFVPSFPGWGNAFSFVPFGTPPWNAFGAVTLYNRPELIGLGYLVSAEISFSIWATFILERLVAVIGSGMGYREAGFPFTQEQSFGAYIAMALVLLYLGRHHLAAIARAAVSSAEPEMRGYRAAFWGFWASVVALVVFCRLLGMQWWVAWVYLGIFLAIALTYARIRAETGIPLIWMFPFGMPKTMLFSIVGIAPLAPGGDPRTLAALAMLSFTSRGFPVAFAGYQVDGLRAGHQVGEKPRRMILGLTAALVIGLCLAFYFHLTGYHRVGAQQVSGGIWGWSMATVEFDNAINQSASPLPRDIPRIMAGSAGFLVAVVLQMIRTRVVGFPLHPLGFAASNAYGSLIWWPFFLVWLTKLLVLRFGGMPLYRKTLPGFLGFALGHFFTAGIIWGLLGATGKNLYEGYAVWFG
ncbi:MAG: hypothetical protein GX774_03125 [Armatimonadetes bacterium]|nr:hypothetical protein [Armatimonadota bacterium]